jgi:hypothetical protein
MGLQYVGFECLSVVNAKGSIADLNFNNSERTSSSSHRCLIVPFDGLPSEHYGRKSVLYLTNVLFITGTFVPLLSQDNDLHWPRSSV